jgi:hypothetical protein
MSEYIGEYLSGYPPWQLALLALLIPLWVIPLWRIVGKAGYPPFISLLAIFPAIGLILLWWLAFAHWPIERNRQAAQPRREDSRVESRGRAA